MDREELMNLIRRGPVRITMNSGDTVVIESLETCVVSSMSADVLVKGDDGQLRTHFYPLVTMSKVELLDERPAG